MHNLSVEKTGEDTLRLTPSARARRGIGCYELFAGVFALLFSVFTTHSILEDMSNALWLERAYLWPALAACALFFVGGCGGFAQASLHFFGREEWIASPNCLEHRTSLWGFHRRKSIQNRLIALRPSSYDNRNRPDWKQYELAICKRPYQSNQHWGYLLLDSSNDGEGLRAVGQLISEYTGWPLVEGYADQT